MAMTTPPQQERSKPLHNFSLPCLKWGNQRTLRCVKVTDNHPHNRSSSSSSIPNGFRFQSKPTNIDSSNNHKAISIQQSPVSPDLRLNGAAAKRLKVSPLLEEDRLPNDDSARPWNLRTRRAACKAPLRFEDKDRKIIDSPKRYLEINSPRRIDNNTSLVKRPSVEPVKEKIKFSVSLSKVEIEQDFMEMTRIRPPRRPKKRPRIVQKYLDSNFPGLWLSEVTPDSYKVPEVPES